MKLRGTRTHVHRPAAALLALTMAAGALAGVAGSAAATTPSPAKARAVAAGSRAPVAPVAWVPCDDPVLEGLDCATVAVPLDYDRPRGATIEIALARAAATSPDQRIGSIFVNPGGPGGSGIDVVGGFAAVMPSQLRERFDLVGFDPRGILRSTPLRCYPTLEQALEDLPPVAYPETPADEDLVVAAEERLADACRDHGGPILHHMSTADVARDLDVLREAVGDEQLSYVGLSYGSILGQTYANLFPDRVRALVIDGVLDPREWEGQGVEGWTVPLGTRLRSAEGAEATLREFFRLCDEAGPDCAVAGDAAGRFAALADRLRQGPIEVTDEFGTYPVTYNDLIGFSLGALYSPFIWPELARLLQQLESAATPTEVRGTLAALRSGLGLDALAVTQAQEEYPNFVEGGAGVACADATNPRGYHHYRRVADLAGDRFGYFGRTWNWAFSACAVWPADVRQDRYKGPWTATTAHPVLVVGNLYDPATPYHGAVAAAELLPGSRLLTYAGWGHTAFLGGNACVDAAVTEYLVSTTTPPAGTVCEPQASPFAQVMAARSVGRAPVIAATLPDAVRRALG
jgi:pimeloyl-ACP methyl ester carboxylesterase